MTAAQYLAEIGAKTATGSRQASKTRDRIACPACERAEAFMRLLRALLDDGHDLRLEYRFHPTRKWRFDMALLDAMLAVEIDGGGWVRGAHHRAAGRENDNAKDAAAMALGWRVLRVSWDHVKSGQALETLRLIIRSGEQEVQL
jgi:very-short-patch-repair endonuclease